MRSPGTGSTSAGGRARKLLAIAAVATLGVVGAAAPAQAHWHGVGQLYAAMEVRPYSYNPTWQAPIDRALANWNATATPVSITRYANSGSSITASSYSDSWYGHYQRCGDNCYYIRLNSRTISANASNFANFVTSTTVHEYGHALNLGHNSVTSIMNTSRNRNSMIRPQQHDIDDVNAYY
jgi:predicted Zn-dependent protease